MDKEKISFVIPCYNSTNTLDAVVAEIEKTMTEKLSNYDFEVILVNDCSPDGTTYDKIKEIASKKAFVKGINLARNFGQPSAVMAAIHYATGDYVVCGDDDGQTPFNEFPKLFTKIQEGYDIVEAKYDIREKRSLFRRFGTVLNESMATWLIDKPKGLELTSYWCIRRFVADEILRYNNPYPYLGGLLLRSSQNVCNVSVTHRARLNGKSGYTLKKLIGLWINGFTSFSIIPLRLTSFLGFLISFLGFCLGIYVVIKSIISNMPPGFATIVCLLLLFFGILFIFLGIMGEYIGRIFISLNNSPQFIIKEKTNIEKNKGKYEIQRY